MVEGHHRDDAKNKDFRGRRAEFVEREENTVKCDSRTAPEDERISWLPEEELYRNEIQATETHTARLRPRTSSNTLAGGGYTSNTLAASSKPLSASNMRGPVLGFDDLFALGGNQESSAYDTVSRTGQESGRRPFRRVARPFPASL